MMMMWVMGLLVLVHHTNAVCQDKWGFCTSIKHMCDNQFVKDSCVYSCGGCAPKTEPPPYTGPPVPVGEGFFILWFTHFFIGYSVA